MFLLGLVLLGATGAFTGLLIAYNSAGGPDYTVTMFGHTLGTLNTLQAFLAGIALTLVFCLSLAMINVGARHMRRRAASRRAALREASQARAERDELAARLDEQHGYDQEREREQELEREREIERERVYPDQTGRTEPVSEPEPDPMAPVPHGTGTGAGSWRQ
jgi:signal transduction histidine kinase